jgi:hypothetical protein
VCHVKLRCDLVVFYTFLTISESLPASSTLVTCLQKAREEKPQVQMCLLQKIHSLKSEAEVLSPEGIGQMSHHHKMSEYTSPSEDLFLVRLMRSKAALQSATQRNSPLREQTLDPIVHDSHKPTDDHQSQVLLTGSAIIPNLGIMPQPGLRQMVNLPPSLSRHQLPEPGNQSRPHSEAGR